MLRRSSDSAKGVPSNDTVFMKAITQKEEDALDKLRDRSDIFFYGDIDLLNEKDIALIRDYNILFPDNNGYIHNNFNYEAGTFTLVAQPSGRSEGETIEYVVKEHHCSDPLVWFKYKHCLLGKPAKVVVYKSQYESYWAKR